jgi:hypothetical protein
MSRHTQSARSGMDAVASIVNEPDLAATTAVMTADR